MGTLMMLGLMKWDPDVNFTTPDWSWWPCDKGLIENRVLFCTHFLYITFYCQSYMHCLFIPCYYFSYYLFCSIYLGASFSTRSFIGLFHVSLAYIHYQYIPVSLYLYTVPVLCWCLTSLAHSTQLVRFKAASGFDAFLLFQLHYLPQS